MENNVGPLRKLMTTEGKPVCFNCKKIKQEGTHERKVPSLLDAKHKQQKQAKRKAKNRHPAMACLSQQQSQHMAEIVGPTPPQALVPAKESYETLLPQLGPLSKEAHDWMVKVTVKRPGHKAQKYALTPSNGAKWGTPLEQRKCYVQTSKPIVENVVTEDAFDAILTGK